MFRHSQKQAQVAVYIRWSTEEQGQGTTLETQTEACLHYAASQGWKVSPKAIFVDDGYSGASLTRPALTRLRTAIRQEEFDTVIIYKLDRLSRNLLDCVTLVRQEWQAIALYSTTEHFDTNSPMGQMVFNLLVSFAEFERMVIRERTQSGKKKRAEQGRNSGFQYSYGYKKGTDGYEIDPDKAPIVQRMFSQALSGTSPLALARMLNQDGIPSPEGTLWKHKTVRDMLNNPIYTGRLEAGAWTRNSEGKYRKGTPKYSMENAVPKIISATDFEDLQAILSNRSRPKVPSSSKYLLSGVLRCGKCGGPMMGHTKGETRYYRCLNIKDHGHQFCDAGLIDAEELEKAVLTEVRKDLAPIELQAHATRLADQRKGQLSSLKAATESIEQSLSQLDTQRNRLDQDYFAGEISASNYNRLTQAIEVQYIQISEQLTASKKAVNTLEKAPDEVERFLALAEQVKNLEALHPDHVRAILRTAIHSLTAYRKISPGQKTPAEVHFTPSIDFKRR